MNLSKKEISEYIAGIKVKGQIISEDALVEKSCFQLDYYEYNLEAANEDFNIIDCNTNAIFSIEEIKGLIEAIKDNINQCALNNKITIFRHFWTEINQIIECTVIPYENNFKFIIKAPENFLEFDKGCFDIYKELESIPNIGFWEFNLKTQTISISSTLEIIFEVEDHQHFDLALFFNSIHPDDVETVFNNFFDENKDIILKDSEFRYIPVSGTLKYIKSKSNTVFNKNGEAVIIKGIIHDQTETKRAEKKLAFRLSSESLITKLYSNLLKDSFETKQVQESLDEISTFFDLKKSVLFIDSTEIRDLFEWNNDKTSLIKENFDVFFNTLYQNINDKIKESNFEGIRIRKEESLSSDFKASFDFFNINGIIAFPLLLKGKQQGVVFFERKFDTEFWDKNEIGIYQTFVNLIQNLCERMIVEKQHDIVQKKLFEAQKINNIGYFELDLKTDKITFSEGLYSAFSLDKDNATMDYASFMRLKHPEDVMTYNKTIRESFKSKTQYKCEYRFFRKDGTIGWAKEIGNTEFDAIGRPLMTFGTIQDISDYRHAKIAIEKSEVEKSTILDSVSESIVYIDKDKKIQWVNKLALNNLSQDSSQIIGQQFIPETFAEVLSCTKSDIDYAFKNGETLSRELETPQGKTLIVNISPVKDKDGFVIGVVGASLNITDRIEVEEELKRNENRLKLATQIAKLGYWENFGSKGIQFWSEETYEILGVPQSSEVTLDNFFDVIHPDDQEFIKKGFYDSINAQYLFEQEFRIIRGDSDIRYIHSKAEHKFNNDQYEYSIGSILDITDRKESEIALQDSEEKYRTLIESADDRIALFDKSWNILLANDAFYEKLGYSKDEYESLLVNEKDFIEKPEHLLHTVNFDGNSEAVLFNYKIENKDGSVMHMSSKNVAIYDNKKMLQGVLTIIRDVTKQWEIELQVKNQQSLIQAIIDNMPIGFWAKDLLNQNRFFIWNNYLENATGFTPDFAIGKTDDELFSEEIAKINRESDLDVLKSNNMMLAQSNIYDNKYGQGRLIRETKKPISDESGRPVAIFGIVEDITEQKKSEEELITAKEKAQESDRLKSTFLANMSHEIRTPLNGILGFAQLLSFKNITQEKKEKFINFIDINAKQLLTIISDIIDIAKIESGQFKIFKQEFELNDVLQNLYTAHSKELKNKEKTAVELKLISPELPIKINSDLSRFKQIFDNLINNAIKFTENGSIEFGYKIKEQELEFFCHDTGIGIAKENHSLIFDRFRQVDESETREFGGTGLGLAISKNLIHLLDGKIWLDSEPKQGSTFYFTLPYEMGIQPATTNDKEEQINDQKEFSWANKRILIVDDVELIFEYISAILDETDVMYDYANSGRKGIEMFKQNEYDLVLMDIQMPEMGGTETKNEIKKINKDINVIAQTANALSEDKKKYLELGFDGYIAKPIDKDELLKLIGTFL